MIIRACICRWFPPTRSKHLLACRCDWKGICGKFCPFYCYEKSYLCLRPHKISQFQTPKSIPWNPALNSLKILDFLSLIGTNTWPNTVCRSKKLFYSKSSKSLGIFLRINNNKGTIVKLSLLNKQFKYRKSVWNLCTFLFEITKGCIKNLETSH